MKNFGKLAVLAAMILAVACFVSCKNGDDDDGGSGSSDGSDGYANTTWITTANVDRCTGKFTLTFDDKNGFVFAEEWTSTFWLEGMYPKDGSMSGTYKVESTKLVLTVTDTSNHGGGPTEDYKVGDTFELQISGGKLHYEAEDEYGSYTFTKSNDDNSGSNNGKDPVKPSEPETNKNVVATYVCEEPEAFDGGYSLTLKFDKDGKFSVIYTKGNTIGEVSKGSYTGDPTKDGNIVFKVENYADYGYLFFANQFKWDGKKTIADQNITITNGKGEFKFWDCAGEEFTRQ